MQTQPRNLPKLLKATYMADRETLLEETRATALYYFPGPFLALLLFVILDISILPLKYSSFPNFPYLTNLWNKFPTIAGSPPSSYLLIFFLLLTLIGLIWFIVRYLRWIYTVYAVTNTRVIVQKGIFSREFDEIPILQVRGVDVHQSVGQRILGYGTIRVSSESGTTQIGNEDWEGIPKPFKFQKLVENATQSFTMGAAGVPGTGTYPRQ